MPGPVLFDRRNLKCIEFNDLNEFTIGRSPTCNINIPETCISRCQCVIKKVPEGEWLIQDKSSFKSTFLNGNKIPQSGQYLKSLDLITFSSLESWQLVFYESQEDVPPSAKRRRLDNDENVQAASQESLPRTTARPSDTPNAVNTKYKLKCQTLTEELQVVLNEKKALETELKTLKEEKDRVDEILIGSHLDSKQLLEDFEASSAEIERLAQERDCLLEELVETANKKEASEAAAHPFGNQSQSSSELESNLIMKTIEVEELKDELQEAKSKLEKAQVLVESLTSQNEKVYNDAVAVLEQEFLCCVCSDLLYEPVTLNCRHTICRDCLKEWKKKKKECPSCRTKIKTEVSPLMVDAFIDRVAPLLGEEFRKRREESKRERTAPKTPPRPPPAPIPPPAALAPVGAPGTSRGNNRGGRGRQRGGRRGQQHNQAPIPIPPPYVVPGVIDLTDRSPAGQANRQPREPNNAEEEGDSHDLPTESDSSSDYSGYSDSSLVPPAGILFPFDSEFDSADDYDYSDTFIDDEDADEFDDDAMDVDDEDEVDDEE